MIMGAIFSKQNNDSLKEIETMYEILAVSELYVMETFQQLSNGLPFSFTKNVDVTPSQQTSIIVKVFLFSQLSIKQLRNANCLKELYEKVTFA